MQKWPSSCCCWDCYTIVYVQIESTNLVLIVVVEEKCCYDLRAAKPFVVVVLHIFRWRIKAIKQRLLSTYGVLLSSFFICMWVVQYYSSLAATRCYSQLLPDGPTASLSTFFLGDDDVVFLLDASCWWVSRHGQKYPLALDLTSV